MKLLTTNRIELIQDRLYLENEFGRLEAERRELIRKLERNERQGIEACKQMWEVILAPNYYLRKKQREQREKEMLDAYFLRKEAKNV